MKFFTFIFTIIFSLNSFAGTSNASPHNDFPHIFHQINFVKNTGIEKNDNDITDASAIASRSTSSPLVKDASLLVDGTADNQLVIFTTMSLDSGIYGQNCEARFIYTGDATLYKAYVRQNSAAITDSSDTGAALLNITSSKYHSINFACGDGSSGATDLVIETTSASAAAIKIDSIYIGLATNVGISPVPNTFSAKVSAAGVVSAENFDWINANASIANTSEFTLTFNGNVFFAAPNCVATGLDTGTEAPIVKVFTQATTTAIVIKTYSNLAVATAFAFNIECSRSSDSVQAGVRLDQANFDWVTETCTGSWTTNTTHTCKTRRDGSSLIVRHKVTVTGAPDTATLTLTIPGSRLIDSAKIPGTVSSSSVLSWKGSIFDSGTNTFPAFAVYASTSTLTVKYINDASTAAPFVDVTQAAPMTFANGDAVEIEYSVPIVSWGENQKAPLLVGGVTSSSLGLVRIEYADITNTGADCTINAQSNGFLASGARNGNGECTMTINTGLFLVAPVCFCNSNDAVEYTCFIENAITTTSVKTVTVNPSVARGDARHFLMCIGAR